MRIKNILDWKKIENLFLFTRQTWSKWKNEKRPIVNLIEKYFTNDELQEFLETNQIEKFELLKDLSKNELLDLIKLRNKQVLISEIAIKKCELTELQNKLNNEKI